jgi:CBS domain-containing protein
MKLKDIITERVKVIAPDASLRDAARLMRDLDVGMIPVCDGERLVGTITDRDIAVRAVAAGRDPNQTLVRDAKTDDVIYCFEDQEVEEAARLMNERQVRRLPVLSREKRLVGIVSLGDLAVRTDQASMAGKTLEGVSEPSHPAR